MFDGNCTHPNLLLRLAVEFNPSEGAATFYNKGKQVVGRMKLATALTGNTAPEIESRQAKWNKNQLLRERVNTIMVWKVTIKTHSTFCVEESRSRYSSSVAKNKFEVRHVTGPPQFIHCTTFICPPQNY